MIYFDYIANEDIFGFFQEGDTRITENAVELTEERHQQLLEENSQGREIVLYNGEVFTALPNQYIRNGNAFVINPNYEKEQAEKREKQFKTDFFFTSLGYIRRKVSMKTGETKDFLTDLLPVISMAVANGQTVNIITYREPDYTHDIEDWESLQEIKQATPLFVQECFAQVSTDFTGI